MSLPIIIPRLETDRLILRAPQESDIESEVEFYASPRAKFVGGPLTGEQVWRMVASFLGHWALRGYGFWAIEDRKTGSYLGRAGLWFPAGWPEREIGWTLMDHAEGRGIAMEAAVAARQYAYDTLGWTTAISMTARHNTRSAALATRMGATLDGSFTHERYGACDIYRHIAPGALT